MTLRILFYIAIMVWLYCDEAGVPIEALYHKTCFRLEYHLAHHLGSVGIQHEKKYREVMEYARG